MKRAWLLIAAWLAATTVTGTVAWAAVLLAGEQTADEAVVPMSAEQVAALAQPAAAAEVGASTTSTTIAMVSSSTTRPAGIPTSLPAASTTTTHASATSTAATTTTTTGPSVAAYETEGGTVLVSWSGDAVSFVGAYPEQGYHAEVEAVGPDEVVVTFEKDEEEIRLRARVSGGTVVFEVDGGSEGD